GLWWTARRRSRPSLVALCCCILLVSAGCTSEDPASPDASTRASDGATADAPSSGDGPDEDGADEGNGEQIAPVVKGKEVTRGGGEDAGGDPREGDGSGSEPGGPGSGSTVPTETRTVPVVSYVTRSADDLPVDSLGSRAAENLITFDWSSRDLEGQSSRLFVPQAAVDLALELTEVDDALLLTAVLTNTSADRRLAVEGRIVHELFDGVGTSLTELESPPLDIVLNPGGHTSVQFSYGLPDGSYRAEATFRPVE
ncbi:MAG TPA: hypothetical protein VFS18_05840, partial [Actinomycetota bacterium]|nr:hypothetical protein [Actinomycetota bacterium]